MVDKAKMKKVMKQFTPKRTAIAKMGSEPMELPNYSGMKLHSQERETFAPFDKLVETFPTSLTAGSVVFSDGTNLSQDNFNLFWDAANKRLEPNLIKITSDGTQASPALKFNDTNTGFYKSGDSVRFSLNNSTKMTIDSTGVGIGTTSPDTKLQIVGDFKTGDDNTNYVTIDGTGNMVFVGGAGLPFAEIYARDNTATTSTSTTKAQILIFDTDGEFNNMTPDHTNDHIIVTKAGKYKIDASISIKNSSGSAHVISLEMYKNDGAVVFNNIHAGRTLGTGTDVGNLTMSGIVDLAVNDTIEFWITSDSGTARTVTVEDIDFCAIQIGGT